MLSKSKSDTKKKSGDFSGNAKFLTDLETISNALNDDKPLSRLATSTASSRSKAVGDSSLRDSKVKLKDSKSNAKELVEKDKKSSVWSWKRLKALTKDRNRRFNCCFSLLVHSIEGLPDLFNDICLVVHWKRGDGEQTTNPIRVYKGVAEFEEQLTHSCSVHGSRSGPRQSAKYEGKHVLLYVSVFDAPKVDLGKHRMDLTRLLPMTLEELEEDKSSGKWTTSFRLSGKAKGATMNISFGYIVMGNNNNSELFDVPNMLQNGGRTSYRRTGSFPSTSTRSTEDIKELHEVLPSSKSERCESVNVLYQKLDETYNSSVEKNLDVDPLSSPVEDETLLDADEKNCETESEFSEFSFTEKETEEESIKEPVKSENESWEVDKGVEEDLETETDTAVQFPVEVDTESFSPAEEIIFQKEELSLASMPENEESLIEPEENGYRENLEESAIKELEEDKDSYENSNETSIKELEDEKGSEENLEEPVMKEVEEEKGSEEKLNESATKELEEETDSDGNSDESIIEDLEEEKGREENLKELVIKELEAEEESDEDSKELVLEENEEEQDSDENSQILFMSEPEEEKDSNENYKESLMKELEEALNCASDFGNEELDSQDENDALALENYSEVKTSFRDCRETKSTSLDDVTDLVANEFLEMLGIDHSPFGLSSESEPESPREKLLRQFEKDVLASGGLLDFEIEDDASEFVDNSIGSVWGTVSEDFYHPSIYESFEEVPEIDSDEPVTKTGALEMKDCETEVLINGKEFQDSPLSSSGGFDSPLDLQSGEGHKLPELSEGLGSFLQTQNGGFLRSMNLAHIKNVKHGGSLIMQVSSPLVVPAEMGSGVMDILHALASVGIEKLSMQASKLMPLEDITGKTIQQIARETTPSLEGAERQELLQQEHDLLRGIPIQQKNAKEKVSCPRTSKFDANSKLMSKETEYVSLEDLAPLAMDKIEALSIEGLRIHSGLSDNDAPSNISTEFIGELSALKGKTVNTGGSIDLDGTCGLQLLDIKDNGEDDDGLIGLSLTLDQWMKLDSGEIDENDLVSERTSKILAAHHATSLERFDGRPKGEKRRERGNCCLLGNNFTVALMVLLRDPLRSYEPVGSPMLALIQVERVFVPPKPNIFNMVSPVKKLDEEDDEMKDSEKECVTETQKEKKVIEEEIPQYKITEVHVAGLKSEGRKKFWGFKNQEQSGSSWLLANGMGKTKRHPLMKLKSFGNNRTWVALSLSTTVSQKGDTFWSISSRVSW